MNVSDAAIMGVVSGHIIVLLGSLLAIIIAVAFCCRRAHQWRWQRKRASELSNEQSTSGIADAEVDRAQVMREIDETLRMATLGYVGWYIAHVVLGICSIALPAIAATLPAEMAKYFSVAGAVAAAIVVFVRPHDFATAFDNACVSVWRTSVEFSYEDSPQQRSPIACRQPLKF